MKTRLFAAMIVAALAVPAAAAAAPNAARVLSDAQIGNTKAELVAQRDFSARIIRFFTVGHRWMLASRHQSCSSVPWTRTCVVARRTLAAHRWLHDTAVSRYERLYPPPVTGHWALWSCITNGAYPGAAHEGDGYNGSYTGPLGMTTPWAGHYPTGGDWVHTPIATVYGYAEQEFIAHGRSISWLYGQWPNTSPPCVAKLGL